MPRKDLDLRQELQAPNEGFEINPLDGTDIQSTNDYTSNLGFLNIDTKSLLIRQKELIMVHLKLMIILLEKLLVQLLR